MRQQPQAEATPTLPAEAMTPAIGQKEANRLRDRFKEILHQARFPSSGGEHTPHKQQSNPTPQCPPGESPDPYLSATEEHSMLLGPGDNLLFEETDAMIAAHLFVAGVLPMEFFEEQYNPRVAQYPCFSLLFWQRGKGIFLDTLCIKQDDSRWKALALLSMPALLKASDSLLVLWDPSYTRRLWCCFEIAAFYIPAQPGRSRV